MAISDPTLTGFVTLPAEILRRITAFTTAETALSLIRCSRRMYNTCYDPFVFRSIIENLNGRSSSTDEPWDISFLPAVTPLAHLIRYAVADSNARTWSKLKDQGLVQAGKTVEDLHLSWSPQLAALGHPFTKSLELLAYVSDFSSYTFTVYDVEALQHFNVNAMLHSARNLGLVDLNNFQFRLYLLDHVEDIGLHALPVTIVTHLIRWYLLNSDLAIAPPSPSKIRSKILSSKLPLPYSPKPQNFLNSYHLPVMTTKEFIEEGEWTGYYSHGVDHNNLTFFDAPMHNIKLCVDGMTNRTSETPTNGRLSNDNTDIEVFGEGIDSVGNFTIAGTISGNGVVALRKTYQAGFWWSWNARMTPWGIMGYWGSLSTDRHGWVWLWKRDWSE